MNVSTGSSEPSDTVVEPPAPSPDAPQDRLALDASLGRRLAAAKARLDRLELDAVSKDVSALAKARVEFTLAARALADHLIAHGLHDASNSDGW